MRKQLRRKMVRAKRRRLVEPPPDYDDGFDNLEDWMVAGDAGK